MIAYRVKYDNIISELFLPKNHNGQTIIFIPGLPSFLGKNWLTKTLTENGFVVFQPFFSGSYDSDGNFSEQNCLNDISTFKKMAEQNNYQELYFNKDITTDTQEIIFFSISFGTSIAIKTISVTNQHKHILISPVLTYLQNIYDKFSQQDQKFNKQMQSLIYLLTKAYTHTYRIKNTNDISSLLLGKNSQNDPIEILSKIETAKLLFLQGQNDTSLSSSITENILKQHLKPDCYDFVTIKEAAHSLSSYDLKETTNTILEFIKK